jgi:XRE family aerobic/anaerobic benzoate catabolism transcriptional regulator
MRNDPLKAALLKEVGQRTRTLRLEAGLTVKAFADHAKLSTRFVNQLEAGTGNISIAGLARIAAALGRSTYELIPPNPDDQSSAAELWRALTASPNELREFQQWLSRRKGNNFTPRFVALIGLRGAGKSTVGPILAKRLKTDFIELDRRVEEIAGMSLGEIFATHGESYYRELQRESALQLLNTSPGCLFVPGGSVVTDSETWESIKRRCFTVWLHATPAEFMKRMRRQGDLRPMQGRPSAMEELKALLARREPLYAESRLKIRTTGKTPAAVASRIIHEISPRTS